VGLKLDTRAAQIRVLSSFPSQKKPRGDIQKDESLDGGRSEGKGEQECAFWQEVDPSRGGGRTLERGALEAGVPPKVHAFSKNAKGGEKLTGKERAIEHRATCTSARAPNGGLAKG